MNFTGNGWNHTSRAGSRAFTIIEMLAVVAIIAIFVGVIGLALTRSGDGPGVHASQRTLSAVFSGARSQAAMRQHAVYILISADETDPDTYLREFRIAQSPGWLLNGSGGIVTDQYGNNIPRVRSVGDSNRLADGVYLIPSQEDASRISPEARAMVDAYDQLLSELSLNADQRKQRTSNATYGEVYFDVTQQRQPYLYYRIDERGFVSGGGHRVVIAPAERGQSSLHFTQPLQAVGLLVRPFGSVTLISDPRGFEEE